REPATAGASMPSSSRRWEVLVARRLRGWFMGMTWERAAASSQPAAKVPRRCGADGYHPWHEEDPDAVRARPGAAAPRLAGAGARPVPCAGGGRAQPLPPRLCGGGQAAAGTDGAPARFRPGLELEYHALRWRPVRLRRGDAAQHARRRTGRDAARRARNLCARGWWRGGGASRADLQDRKSTRL